jgi:bacillithiol system protein YtxJ
MKARIIDLDSIEKLDKLIKFSAEAPVLIYKHSATCGISDYVYDDVAMVDSDINVVVVQTARPVSDEIAARTGIRHASPQAIVLKNGKAIYSASHYDITADDIAEAMGLKG